MIFYVKDFFDSYRFFFRITLLNILNKIYRVLKEMNCIEVKLLKYKNKFMVY